MAKIGENGENEQGAKLLDGTAKKISASGDLGKQTKAAKNQANIKYKIIPQNVDVKSTY